MNDSLQEKQDKRFRVLKRIYEESGGSYTQEVKEDTIIKTERVTAEELVREILPYLQKEGLIRFFRFRSVAIEHLGIKEMEQAAQFPDHDTENFSATVIPFHAPVQNVQTGNQNVQNIYLSQSPEVNEALSKLKELIEGTELSKIGKDDGLEILERLGKLSHEDSTAERMEAATKRIDTLKNLLTSSGTLAATAVPYLTWLYHFFANKP